MENFVQRPKPSDDAVDAVLAIMTVLTDRPHAAEREARDRCWGRLRDLVATRAAAGVSRKAA